MMQKTQLGRNGALSTPIHAHKVKLTTKPINAVKTNALFTKSRTVKQEAITPPPKKKSFYFFSSSKKQDTTASKTMDKAAEYKKRQGLGGIVSAFDFAEVRSKSDAELLYEAKYGARTKDGKMTREQYAALRRKVGGTAKDFWKTSIDVKGTYTDKGWVDETNKSTASSVPALPLLVAVIGALFGTVVYVVSQTS